MAPVISVQNLGKKYILNHQPQERYVSLRDVLANKTKQFGQKIRHPFKQKIDLTHEEFWALKDINFEIQQGDKVGIIGRNGAGKSTLLKILSRITEPTTGSLKIKGRVASLLEVGTGFHPELTGRENIYLNGAILGMSRNEIRRKFDEIVAFAEVEKFLDTPVKRYSSGMYMRLAFSVAAHLEPEILIVDEVLAVGDAQFQKKCMGKMKEVGSEGRTVLFVSHNMNSIEQLCDKGLLLRNGEISQYSTNVNDVISNYLSNQNAKDTETKWENTKHEFFNEWFTPESMRICSDTQIECDSFSKKDIAQLIIEGTIKSLDRALQVGYALYSEDEELVYWTCHNDVAEEFWPKLVEGRVKFRSTIPLGILNEGRYRIELLAALYCRQWICDPGVKSATISFELRGGVDSPYLTIKRPGVLAPIINWVVE